MSELLGGDETLFSLWPDHFLHKTSPSGLDWQSNLLKVDQQLVPVPILLLDDGRIAFRNDDGKICILDGMQGGSGEDVLLPLPLAENSNAELPPLSDAAIKSLFSQAHMDPELPLVGGGMPDLPIPSLSPSPVDDDLKALMSFRCQYCSFSSADVPRLMDHLKKQHQQSQPETRGSKEEAKNNSLQDVPSESADYEPPAKETVEQFVYLCSECKRDFSSVCECRDHMIKDHSMVFVRTDDEAEKEVEEDSTKSYFPPPPAPVCSPPLPCESPTTPPPPVAATASPPPTAIKPPSNQGLQYKKSRSKPIDNDPEFEAKPQTCPILFCCYKFRTTSAMQAHLECHVGDQSHRFVCPECTSVFVRWSQCALHLWNTHKVDIDLYACNICNVYRTTTKKKLECHMKIHSDERPYKCTECEKGFKQSSQLANHMVSVHHKNKGVGNKWYMSQKCEVCLKVYADIKCLKKHVQAVHSKLKPYKCQICGHMSARKAMLNTHMRQHTGEKPFACQHCDYRTGDHNSLRKHMMRHTGVKPYSCPHCPYASIQSTSFKCHVTSKHPGQSGVYTCSECCFVSISEQCYNKHVSDHRLNLIPSEIEVFPENVAAAHLVYRSLGASPSRLHCDVTGSTTSHDRMKQTITISIPSQESAVTDDEDTAHCYLPGDEMDTGGITIPADPEPDVQTSTL